MINWQKKYLWVQQYLLQQSNVLIVTVAGIQKFTCKLWCKCTSVQCTEGEEQKWRMKWDAPHHCFIIGVTFLSVVVYFIGLYEWGIINAVAECILCQEWMMILARCMISTICLEFDMNRHLVSSGCAYKQKYSLHIYIPVI